MFVDMFNNTLALFRKTVEDVKRLSRIISTLTLVVHIVYLTYSVATGAKWLPLNVSLLVLAVAYLCVQIAFQKKGNKLDKKQKRRRGFFNAQVKLRQYQNIQNKGIRPFRQDKNTASRGKLQRIK